jgi:D-alanyl-D-alanine carboxypeptidase (penicillin-binding protein 5/6)
MNCPTINGKRTEFTTSKQLFKWAFTEFSYRSVLDVKTPVTEIGVRLSSDSDYVSLYPVKQLRSILPKEADNSSIVIEPHLVAESVDAPIKKGDVLGTADVIFAERVIGTVDLIAGNDVESSASLVALDGVRKVITSTAVKTIIFCLIAAVVLFILYVAHINKKGKKQTRKVKYIPYDKEKEEKLRKKRADKRAKANRPEYASSENDGDYNYFDI